MNDALDNLEAQLKKSRDFDHPPLHEWHPPLSGDIPIRIARDGTWFHEGEEIRREALVRLFASILRREEDGEYYLVTPVEKWRIEVEAHALVVTDIEAREGDDGETILVAVLNTGKEVVLGLDHPLFLDRECDDIAAVGLWHGLSALLTRAAWYRLVDMAQESGGVPCVRSAGITFKLLPD